MNIKKIKDGDDLLAIIIRYDSFPAGINFVTETHHSQQVGYMSHPEGHIITPHVHKPVNRSVDYTQEVLILKKGKLQANFYRDDREFLCSEILQKDDICILIKGGHGFKVLESLEMIEVKQGPYAGDMDKERFDENI